MTARSEAVRLDHRCRLGKPPPDRSRVVGVAAEGDHLAALVPPPIHDLAVTAETLGRATGVDLQGPTAISKCTQGLTELIFERERIEGPGLGRPVADRVVDVEIG